MEGGKMSKGREVVRKHCRGRRRYEGTRVTGGISISSRGEDMVVGIKLKKGSTSLKKGHMS